MSNLIFVKGSDIYAAAVEGAKRGYNRSTNDYSVYEKVLDNEYELLIKNCTSDNKKRKQIRMNTHNSWKKAIIPLCRLMNHGENNHSSSKHHVRVLLQETMTILDIPSESWEKLASQSH